jgi:predicted DNA-binding ArsR family transcriptional regulator
MDGSWAYHIHFAEFTYNSNYHASIDMSSLETLYDHLVRTPVCYDEVSTVMPKIPQMLEEIAAKMKLINERLKSTQD